MSTICSYCTTAPCNHYLISTRRQQPCAAGCDHSHCGLMQNVYKPRETFAVLSLRTTTRKHPSASGYGRARWSSTTYYCGGSKKCYWSSRVQEAGGNVRELWKTVSHLLVPQTAPHDNFSAQQFSDGGQLHADFISVFPDTAALLFACHHVCYCPFTWPIPE